MSHGKPTPMSSVLSIFASHKTTPKKLEVPSPLSSPPVTEVEKMVSGLPYSPIDPTLLAGRAYIRIQQRLHATASPLDIPHCLDLLRSMLGSCGPDCWIEPPVYFDYGANTHLGRAVYMNYNCILLDVAPIRIGDRTMLASGVQLLTATHPIEPVERNSGVEYGRPITIGKDCWLGGGAIICPGVTIGDGAVVGAGAVVVKDVAPYTVVGGNPARKIKDVPRVGEGKPASPAETGGAAG